MMSWQTIDRPSYFGKQRDEKFRAYDARYGKDKWRIAWTWLHQTIDFQTACMLYEDGYYQDSFTRTQVWDDLLHSASDVYDYSLEDMAAGIDYQIQNGQGTHLQDIAIRRVVLRRGWKFEGTEPVQVRGRNGWGKHLSPGHVPFHMPENIVVPHITGWWDDSSIEDFYQSNKVLQIRDQ